MPTGEAALDRLTNPASEVSSHYFVWEDGRIDQPSPRRRARGTPERPSGGDSDLNSASIGIEIVNPGHDGGDPPFPTGRSRPRSSWRTTVSRAGASRGKGCWPIPTSPPPAARSGRAFPWRRLWGMPASATGSSPPRSAAERLPPRGGWAAGAGAAGDAGARRLRRSISPASTTGVLPAAVEAFQRHFRPERVNGEADASTVATLKALIEGLAWCASAVAGSHAALPVARRSKA